MPVGVGDGVAEGVMVAVTVGLGVDVCVAVGVLVRVGVLVAVAAGAWRISMEPLLAPPATSLPLGSPKVATGSREKLTGATMLPPAGGVQVA